MSWNKLNLAEASSNRLYRAPFVFNEQNMAEKTKCCKKSKLHKDQKSHSRNVLKEPNVLRHELMKLQNELRAENRTEVKWISVETMI